MEKDIFSEGLARYFTAEQMRVLANTKVGIAGVGGLGSNCAMMLARCGVGNFVLVDDDVVDASNLNRQHFFPKHIGRAKVDALAEQLYELSEHIHVDAVQQRLHAENIHPLFASCSLVIEAVDLASTKALIIQELLSSGKTVVAASGMAGWGGEGMIKKKLGRRLIVVGDFVNEVSTAQEVPDEQTCEQEPAPYDAQSTNKIKCLPPLAPRVIMAASMQADAALEVILGTCPAMRSATQMESL